MKVSDNDVRGAMNVARKRRVAKTNLYLEADLVDWMRPRFNMSRLVNELLRQAKRLDEREGQ
jgi:hypothetical protein